MLTKEQRQTIVEGLKAVLAGAPYEATRADSAANKLGMIVSDAEAIGLVQKERDSLQIAVLSIKAGLRQKGPKGDDKRSWARQDISKFSSVGNFLKPIE